MGVESETERDGENKERREGEGVTKSKRGEEFE